MFIYLSKKIAIPNNTKINAIAWNKQDGYIAVGGENGLLKVLKLDSVSDNEGGNKNRGLAATSNLSMNQTLEGHSESIQVLIWNESHKKLTTSDQHGVIIVWMLYKGAWYEEMINNRKKSTVVGMAWSADGQKICIIYEDGAVIVGCVGGNRIWGKELKHVQLSGVQWSPDGKLLLFSLKNGQVHLYDNQGNFVMRVNVVCHDTNYEQIPIVGLDWYNGINGYMHALCPNLAITFENGRTQVMRNESDTNPIIIDTRMFAVHCSWNHNGSLLAISGKQFAEEKEINLVQFYNPFGEHLRTLKVPGNSISCCVWEGGSLRVALAVDSFVYFANIRPDYKWCYFKKTVVFTSCRPHKPGICLSFWDTSNNQCHTRWVSVLLAIAGYGDHCIVATRSESDESLGKYGLLLYNTLGTPVDGKYINIEPLVVTMNSYQVFAASKNNFLVWHYKTPKSITAGSARCKMFHIDDNPSGAVEIIQELDNVNKIQVSMHDTIDAICCITATDKCLIIGRESGLIQYYALPHIVLTNRYKISTRPHKMSINCNSTRLSVIDVSGVMSVIDISEGVGRPTTSTEGNKLERKDVWAMCWASDNPQLLAIMEKTRMYIFKGIYPEEPVACSGYICSFNDLEIQAVLLDEVMDTPEKPSSDHIIKLEVKSLRDTRQLLEKVGINEACQFVEDNRHPRLWRLVAEAALKEMNLTMADACFVRSKDYSKVLFVKKLGDINNEAIRRARIATYFKNFDEAEKIYMEADRSDLALNLRQTLGDWFRVIQILKNGVTAPDYLLKTAYNSTADYFAHFNNWASAIEYYELGRNTTKMIECYYHLEDWKNLEGMIDKLPEGDPLLEKIGDMFAANAVHNEAVKAYVKLGKVKSAINLCIMHNRWDVAIDLAKKFNISKISDLLMKYTNHLVEQGQVMNAIQMNVQARYYLHAAEHAYKLAECEARKSDKNLLKVKKFYVYAARLVELHKKSPNSSEWQSSDPLFYETAWKGAEAYHYYMLAQRQLYSGKLHDALCIAYKLQDYTDFIPESDVYALLTLTACLDRSFGICSKALMKLKSLKNLSATEYNHYNKLAWDIFRQNEPVNVKKKLLKCDNCDNVIQDWCTICGHCKVHFPTCIASGQSIVGAPIWFCQSCRHPAVERKMSFQNACPLCHAKNERQ
ncbi:WD repeat-containing protein 35 isoform X2 [Anoplophora glabripennis]|uniref:WD repeat-containing protein 35 isoform X2 n=1 Tax=Anoplophora glabripennis TaxID=217634 RepID=UPI0008759038|nr:WD repeat-containing protein 35 isoform X2 [Anoplophora glabripennis]